MQQTEADHVDHKSEDIDFDNGDDDWVDDDSESVSDEPPSSPSSSESSSSSSSSDEDAPDGSSNADDSHTKFFPGAAKTYGDGKDILSQIAEDDKFHEERKVNRYYPFSCETEWELASWLARLDVPMSAVDNFLKLKYVCKTHYSAHLVLLIQCR